LQESARTENDLRILARSSASILQNQAWSNDMHPDTANPPSRAIVRGERYILGAAGTSLVLSVLLFFSGEQELGIFVGIWVPTILSFGTFLKIGRA
jgi:hypothetical protein